MTGRILYHQKLLQARTQKRGNDGMNDGAEVAMLKYVPSSSNFHVDKSVESRS
jgi:hypothetical protein